MKNVDLKKQRDCDLYDVYRRGLQEGRFDTVRAAADYVRKQSAPRFYISAREACRLVARIEAGKPLRINPTSLRRIFVIYARFRDYMRRYPESPKCEAFENIVCEPAPEFYIGWEMAKKIILNKRAEARRRLYESR